MPTAIKICGIRDPVALDAALAAGATAVGLNLWPASPRAVTPAEAAALVARAGGLLAVALLVDPDDALVDAAAASGAAAVQLHGDEPPERLAQIRARTGRAVWKAVGVATAADVHAATHRYAAADLLLIDARPPPGAALPGGNGLRFDWRILHDARPAMPWGLAGGLTAETVGEAIRLVAPPLVDVSSGVESAPGVKDVARIADFVKAARRA